MAEDDSQERTEEATPKRKEDMKKKGSVLRSKELNNLVILWTAAASFLIFGGQLARVLADIMYRMFSVSRDTIFNEEAMEEILVQTIVDCLTAVAPMLLLLILAVLLGPLMLGGWTMAPSNFIPKLERLDPIKGLQKIFSLKAIAELIKSALKIVLIIGLGSFLMWVFFDEFLMLANKPLIQAMGDSLYWLVFLFFCISSTLAVVTAVDIPFQVHEFTKESKMTKQEVKDEFKETEGRPEVKSQIQKMQRQMSRQRMMQALEEADVIITNPTHFAVALKYNAGMSAPKLVAKGQDLMAHKIRDKGKELSIPIVELPPLARALYFSTELDEEIPYGLYKAVAKVLAYIHQLAMYRRGRATRPKDMKDNDVDIPTEYER